MRARALERMFRDTITVRAPGSVDEYGQTSSSTGTTVRARVVRNHTRSRSDDGEEFISTTQVATLHPIKVGDTLVIDGVERPVRAVKSAQPLRGGVTLTEAHL